MKKYLFLILSILSIFFITDRVDALSFTASNGKEYTVDSKEKLLDYCYYTYFKGKNYKYLGLVKTDNSTYPYKCFVNNNYKFYVYIKGSTFTLYNISPSFTYTYYQFKYDFSYLSSGLTVQDGKEILYINTNVYTDDTYNDIYFNSNFTIEEIESRYGVISTYKITYYLNNEIYKELEVEDGTSYELEDYIPPKNYSFSGWSYDENLDLSNITSNINIYGTTSYVRPDMNYSENIDSIIHELSVSIIGKNVPVEFDYVYTIMDFIILIVLVLCVIAPFVIIIKLLNGRW